MKETEVQVEETEVERVYCDDCGTECTDDYRVQPSEVCVSCSDETAVDRVAELMTPEPDSDEKTPIPFLILAILLYPLMFAIMCLAYFDDDLPMDGHKMRIIIFTTFGAALWGAIGLLLLL